MKSVGSRSEVMHGHANHTSGMLKKQDLKYVRGSIVSKAASKTAKQRLKSSSFQKFVLLAKNAKKSGKLKLSPKKGTKQYKILIKK